MRLLAVDFPFAPRRFPVFYGWVVAVVGTIGVCASVPGQTTGFAAFQAFIAEDAAVTDELLSTAYLFGTVGSGLILPFCGRLFDLMGARLFTVLTGIFFGLSLLYMAAVLWISETMEALAVQLHLAPEWGDFAALAVGIFGIRFFGQGTLTMASRAMIGKWFNVRRGLVMSLSMMLMSLVFPISTWVFLRGILWVGWSWVYVILAILCGFLMALIAALFFRDNPEECGLRMDDGAEASASQRSNPELTVRREMSLREALCTWSFWSFNLTAAFGAFFVTGFTYHIVSIGAESLHSAEESVLLLLPMAVIGLIASLGVAWLLDRVRLKFMNIAMSLALAATALGIVFLPNPAGYGLLYIGGGVAMSIFQPLTGTVWPRFFGRQHLGAISGFNMSSIVIASGFAPLVFIALSKEFGSFDAPLVVSAATAVLLAVGAFWGENPQRHLGEAIAKPG
ncbi:MAG: MFS transporter [Verrucomicrobiota bacterium]